MRILTLMGSPRIDGNTATVLKWVENELWSTGNSVERINIVEKNIKGCCECYHCQNHLGGPRCSQQDDAPAIFRSMSAADAVTYATPLFTWCFSGQMKPFIDRHFCLVTGDRPESRVSLLAGKPISLLVTAAGPIEGNADLILEMFHRLALGTHCTIASTLVVPFCATPDRLDEDVRRSANQFAREIVHYCHTQKFGFVRKAR